LAMDHIRVGDPVSLQLPSQFREVHGRLGTIEGSGTGLPTGVLANLEYRGIAIPVFYTTRIALPQLGNGVRPGMSGQAKIFGRRRSLADRMVIVFGNVLHTHFW
jgi:hypothetical protein